MGARCAREIGGSTVACRHNHAWRLRLAEQMQRLALDISIRCTVGAGGVHDDEQVRIFAHNIGMALGRLSIKDHDDAVTSEVRVATQVGEESFPGCVKLVG